MNASDGKNENGIVKHRMRIKGINAASKDLIVVFQTVSFLLVSGVNVILYSAN